jgi:DNA-binding MarR family transcriptional regulator
MARQQEKAALRVVEPTARDEAEASIPLDLGPLAEMTGYALRRAQIAVFEDFIEALAEVDLRPAQFSVLHVLDRAPGCTQSAVASALGIQRANFVALLDTLETRGLARRAPSPTDKRSHALYLTPEGMRVLARARELEAAHEARQIERLGGKDKRAELLALAQKLAAR